MRVVFFGSGEFGLPTLEHLSRAHEVLCVVTQPDKPAGRARERSPTPIGAWAASQLQGVPLLKPEDVNDAAELSTIRSFPADAWVVIAFGQKLGPALLRDRFAVNLHASLLPRWRGAAPIHHAVLAGDAETGNSVITLSERMDAGLILAQSRRPIEPSSTTGSLHDLLSADGPALIERVLDAHARGGAQGRPQDSALVTRAGKLSRADAWVDLTRSAEECRRRINGLSPWPGVTSRFRGGDLKLLRAEVWSPNSHEVDGHSRAEPGVIVDAASGLLACGQASLLRLLEVQAAGKRAMSWAEFSRGQRIQTGERIEGARPC